MVLTKTGFSEMRSVCKGISLVEDRCRMAPQKTWFPTASPPLLALIPAHTLRVCSRKPLIQNIVR